MDWNTTEKFSFTFYIKSENFYVLQKIENDLLRAKTNFAG